MWVVTPLIPKNSKTPTIPPILVKITTLETREEQLLMNKPISENLCSAGTDAGLTQAELKLLRKLTIY